MVLILCGFSYAGKTTIGKLCSQHLSLPFYDIDQIIVGIYSLNKTPAQIWHELGPESFRALETEAILSLKRKPAIVALGGGSLLHEKNREHLKQLGVSIYLKASVSLLYQRVLKRGWPAYLDRSRPFTHFKEIALERFPIYESFCDHILEVENISEPELVEKIVEHTELGDYDGWK